MDDKMLELISAYVDGQATAPQIQEVEALLKQDPEARRVFEDMKAFGAAIAASGPAEAAVPADFRGQVMERIRLEAAVPTDPGSGGSMGKLISSPYMISGLVLTALLGTMAYLDLTKSKPKPDSSAELAVDSANPGAVPRLREVAGAHADDVQEAGSQSQGQAYVRGQGGLRDKAQGGQQVLPTSGQASWLEQSSAWSEADVLRALPDADSSRLLLETQRNRINPGLMVAAVRYLGAEDYTSVGRRIRDSLNLTSGRAESERLGRVIRDLGGDEKQTETWSRLIRKEGGR